MVKVNPPLPRGGNARLLLGKPTLGGFINSDQQGSRADACAPYGFGYAESSLRCAAVHPRSAELPLPPTLHSWLTERRMSASSWRKFPPDLLYSVGMASNRLQHGIASVCFVYFVVGEISRRSCGRSCGTPLQGRRSCETPSRRREPPSSGRATQFSRASRTPS